ncbi:DUF2332 family protein, partial [Streptomyces sp. NPDC002285]
MTDHIQLAETFRRFADQQAMGLSPLYATLSRAVARTPELLDLAARTQPGQPAPNMLLAAVHHILRRGVKHPLAPYFTGSPWGSSPARRRSSARVRSSAWCSSALSRVRA